VNSRAASAHLSEVGTTAPIRLWRTTRASFHILSVWLAAILLMPWMNRRMRNRIANHFARSMLRTFDVRVKITGVLPAANRATILVANHVSWLDPHLLNLVLNARYISKLEVASYPLVGTIARQFGAIFIRRGRA